MLVQNTLALSLWIINCCPIFKLSYWILMQECQASPAKHCNDVLYPNRNPALILLSSWQVLQRDWASSWTCSKQDALQATHYHLLGYTKNYNETQGCVSWFCSTIAHNATKNNTIRQPYKFTPKVNSMLVIWWVTAILLTFWLHCSFLGCHQWHSFPKFTTGTGSVSARKRATVL